MSLIISIDGNIGSGKSTFINNLKKKIIDKNIIFIDEPVELWSKICVNNTSILEAFYNDQIKYAFSFQMIALISRVKLLQEAIKKNPNAIIITERSLYSDKNIFAQMLYDEGKIDSYSFQIYKLWFNEYIKELPEHQFLYLYSDPKIVYNRIINRNRDGENNITYDYLINCNDYHERMFLDNSKLLAKINMNYDIESNNYNKLMIDTIDLLTNKLTKYQFINKYNKLLNAYLSGIISIFILYWIYYYIFYYIVKINY